MIKLDTGCFTALTSNGPSFTFFNHLNPSFSCMDEFKKFKDVV